MDSEVQSLEAAVGQPAVKRARDGAGRCLDEGELLLEVVGIEGYGANEYVLRRWLTGSEVGG